MFPFEQSGKKRRSSRPLMLLVMFSHKSHLGTLKKEECSATVARLSKFRLARFVQPISIYCKVCGERLWTQKKNLLHLSGKLVSKIQNIKRLILLSSSLSLHKESHMPFMYKKIWQSKFSFAHQQLIRNMNEIGTCSSRS